MNQKEVADKSGFDASYISGLEKGERNPTFVSMTRVASGLGVDCSKILAVAEIYAAGRSRIKD